MISLLVLFFFAHASRWSRDLRRSVGTDQAILLNRGHRHHTNGGTSQQGKTRPILRRVQSGSKLFMCDLFIARNRMLLDAGISHRLDNSGPDLYRAGDQSDFPAQDNVGEYEGGGWIDFS